MDLGLAGKRAIVTGGSRGIGKAIAAALVDEGVCVAIAARSSGPLHDAAAELSSRNENVPAVLAVETDTSSDSSVSAMVSRVVESFGGVDILVNSAAQPAGQGPTPKLVDVRDDDIFPELNVKLMGYLRCIREVAPHMRSAGWGRVVNVSGLGARRSGSLITSVRNVAVAALTKNAADELGRYGINVSCVHPGTTRTEATSRVMQERASRAGTTVAEAEAAAGAQISIGRIVDASEVADVVAFLCSPRSVAITGDSIACGGGQLGTIYY